MNLSHSVLFQQSQNLSEEELIDKAKAGEAIAFEVIVRRYNQTLFRVARSIMSDDAKAQDVVQDAYINAFTHIEGFRAQASLKTWLSRIVVNQALSEKRKEKHAVYMDDISNVVNIHESQGHDMTDFFREKATPENTLANTQMRLILQKAMDSLPANYRSVLVMRLVEEMSVADTALCLSLTEDVVKTRLSRARKMLQEYINQRFEQQVQEVYEFAGKRCDALTYNVLTQLQRQGIIQTKRG